MKGQGKLRVKRAIRDTAYGDDLRKPESGFAMSDYLIISIILTRYFPKSLFLNKTGLFQTTNKKPRRDCNLSGSGNHQNSFNINHGYNQHFTQWVYQWEPQLQR